MTQLACVDDDLLVDAVKGRLFEFTSVTPVHQAVTLVHSTDRDTGYERTTKHSLISTMSYGSTALLSVAPNNSILELLIREKYCRNVFVH